MAEEKRKSTKQRQLMLKLLQELNRPVSVGELYEKLKPGLPNLAKSTLYRNMDYFVKEDLVDKYYLNDNEVFYKIKHEKEDHEHYLICECCKKMVHLPFCPLSNLEDYIQDTGFLVKEHYIQISGLCKSCKEKKEL